MECDVTPDEQIVLEVFMTVSEAEDRQLWSLPSLSTVVDPDGLNELFESGDAIDTDDIGIEENDPQHPPDSGIVRAKGLKVTIDQYWQELDETTPDNRSTRE